MTDGSGYVQAIWFNQPYLKTVFKEGAEVILSGKVEFFRGLQIKSPEYEFLSEDQDEAIHTGRIAPIYPLTEGLSQKVLRKIIFQIVSEFAGSFFRILTTGTHS